LDIGPDLLGCWLVCWDCKLRLFSLDDGHPCVAYPPIQTVPRQLEIGTGERCYSPGSSYGLRTRPVCNSRSEPGRTNGATCVFARSTIPSKLYNRDRDRRTKLLTYALCIASKLYTITSNFKFHEPNIIGNLGRPHPRLARAFLPQISTLYNSKLNIQLVLNGILHLSFVQWNLRWEPGSYPEALASAAGSNSKQALRGIPYPSKSS
jgi:hypothetical protein